jgi:5-methylcytosine-specific restriction endonuclease McrA
MSDTLLLNADGMPLSLVPLSVVGWQVAMRLIFTEKVKVLKEYDDWVVRSQHLEMPVPSIIIMSEQVKWAKTLKYSRNNVYLRDDFTCQLQSTSRCKDRHGKSNIADLTLDHVVPKSHGGKTNWTNVVTCCKTCNSEKGNDHTIVPKKAPIKPTYYQILAKRKTLPVHIKDEEWKYYIQWPEHLVTVVPHQQGAHPTHQVIDDDIDVE